MDAKSKREYTALASEVAGPIHQVATRLVEQTVSAVVETHVTPLRQAIVLALHELSYHNHDRAVAVLRQALKGETDAE